MTTEKMKETMEAEETVELKFECCFCGKTFGGFGYDPWPVKEEGRCCTACYAKNVLPARILETVTSEEPRKDRNFKCCICGFWTGEKEFGNNPWPIKNEGDCCDYCNWNIVFPARLEKLKKKTE